MLKFFLRVLLPVLAGGWPVLAAAQPIVFQYPTDGPPSGYVSPAVPGSSAPVTVTYSDNAPMPPPSGRVAGYPLFNWARYPATSYVLRQNAVSAFFGTAPGGIATWKFSEPLVGDPTTQRTRIVMGQELQFASYRITLQGGATWTAVPQHLPACVDRVTQRPRPPLVAVSGTGSATLSFMRPPGITTEGCDDFYLEATGPISGVQMEALQPVSSTLNGQPFMPVDEVRLYFGVQDAVPSIRPQSLALYRPLAAPSGMGGISAVPALTSPVLMALQALLALGAVGACRRRAR